MVIKSRTPRDKREKSVRFASTRRLCEYHDGLDTLTEEMCDQLWYQPDECTDIRLEARESSLSATRKGLSAYINRTYGHTDKKTQEMYNLWARCSDSRRGLERFINEEYGKDRKQRQRKTVQAVLYAQDRLRNDGELNYNRASAVISNVCTTISADAVAFAAMMGKADYAAVVRRRVTVVRRIKSMRRNSADARPQVRPQARPQTAPLQSRIKTVTEDDGSEFSDTVPVMGQSPEQRREKKEKRDQRKLIRQANFGRREITFIPQR